MLEADVNVDALKTLIDLGGQAILLFLLFQVWQRLNDVTDRLIAIAEEQAEAQKARHKESST